MRVFIQQKQNQLRQQASSDTTKSSAIAPTISDDEQRITHLQRTIGNQAVLRLLRSIASGAELPSGDTAPARTAFSRKATDPETPLLVQTKLTVNTPGDIYEQEADRIADQVMRMREPQIQRTCACGGSCPEVHGKPRVNENARLQITRAASGDLRQTAVPLLVYEVLSSPGQPLAPETRALMEARLGYDFGGVRVHTDHLAARSAEAVAAHAYTVGADVVFAASRYDPASRDGQRLLAHELAHVVQQNGARAAGPLSIQDGNDAEELAANVASTRLTHHRPDEPRLESSSDKLLRQKSGHRSTSGPAGVPAEKWSEMSETTYRRGGQMRQANAVRRCREEGGESCFFVLTEEEARAAYQLAKDGHSPREAATKTSQSTSQTLARSRVEGAAAALPALAPLMPALSAPALAVGQAVIAALPAVAIGSVAILFVLALAEEVRISRFLKILEAHGFIILLNPLGCAIGACHAASTARALPRDIPWPDPRPLDLGRLSPDRIRDIERWLTQEAHPVPAPRPVTPPPPPPAWTQPRAQPRTGPKTSPEPKTTPTPTTDVIPVPPTRTDPDTEEQRRRRTCATLYPTMLLCADPKLAGYRDLGINLDQARGATFGRVKIKLWDTPQHTLDRSPTLLDDPKTEKGPCVGQGTHSIVKDKNLQRRGRPGETVTYGSIVCCPCCTDVQGAPVTSARCAFIPKPGWEFINSP
jgi:hypothetical protein